MEYGMTELWGGTTACWELSRDTLPSPGKVKEVLEEVARKPRPTDEQESAWHFAGSEEKRTDWRWENRSELIDIVKASLLWSQDFDHERHTYLILGSR